MLVGVGLILDFADACRPFVANAALSPGMSFFTLAR